jgi:GNAT superfamily N-acetyltransferase
MLSLVLVDPRSRADLWRAFVAAQRLCYERYGAASAVVDVDVSAGHVWCVVALCDERTVAGARLHVRAPGHPLPLERVLGEHPVLRRELRTRGPAGIAEVGGLWAAEEWAGTGIGGPVIAATVACAAALGVRHLASFAHQFNRFTRAVGFEPDPRLGEHAYPDERYRSTVNWCDAFDPITADPFVLSTIRSWRQRALAGDPMPYALFAANRERAAGECVPSS